MIFLIYVKIYVNSPSVSNTSVLRQAVPASPGSIPVRNPTLSSDLNTGPLAEVLPCSDSQVAAVVIFSMFDAIYLCFHDKVKDFFPRLITFASKIRSRSESGKRDKEKGLTQPCDKSKTLHAKVQINITDDLKRISIISRITTKSMKKSTKECWKC